VKRLECNNIDSLKRDISCLSADCKDLKGKTFEIKPSVKENQKKRSLKRVPERNFKSRTGTISKRFT
jgi:hypothetical protein